MELKNSGGTIKKKLYTFFLLAVCISSIQAQSLTGTWYSADSTRQYEIKQVAADEFAAVIKSSVRTTDSVGYEVVKHLSFNAKKKRYEGIIYAVSDGQPAFVKIRFADKNSNRLILTIDRMLFMDVSLNWMRMVN
jgi:hypothetical protein